MADPKDAVASAITRAQADLTQALSDLERISHYGRGAVAYAAHALNNYLTVTGAAVELISRRLADHPDAQIRLWLEGVAHATEMMANLVSHLMSASVTAGTKLRFEKADLTLTIQRLCDFYQRAASQKSIRLILDSPGELPPVWVDRVAFLSVLDNLVSNAIKYSTPGKRVWVRVQGEPNGVLCAVRDEGPGLNPAEQAQLFQKGVQLTPRPTAGESSTGYGLAIAKDLVEKLGGEIWCESEVGQGTCFFVQLPLYREESSSSKSP